MIDTLFHTDFLKIRQNSSILELVFDLRLLHARINHRPPSELTSESNHVDIALKIRSDFAFDFGTNTLKRFRRGATFLPLLRHTAAGQLTSLADRTLALGSVRQRVEECVRVRHLLQQIHIEVTQTLVSSFERNTARFGPAT